ncbi:Mu-like prophage major head subunit gpT family protein [Vibrio cholerae]|nr:Mu-like prophage major head subunit gpT family protein [Vibrio cholerae]
MIYQNRRPFVFKNMNPNEEYTWFNNKLVAVLMAVATWGSLSSIGDWF